MGSSSPCQYLYSNRDQLGKPKGIYTKDKFDYSSVPHRVQLFFKKHRTSLEIDEEQ